MRLKNRLFPYPVINRELSLSNYKTKKFALSFEKKIDNGDLVLQNLKIETDSDFFKKSFRDGDIGIKLVVECSATVFRQAFEISLDPTNLKIAKNDLSGFFEISAFAYARKDFSLVSSEFDEDYEGLSFAIDRYDILAVDDGLSSKIEHPDADSSVASSIFSIISSSDLNDQGYYESECEDQKKILISLPETQYKDFQAIYKTDRYKEVFFNMFLIPALADGLLRCQSLAKESEEESFDSVCESFPWFRSVIRAYKKLTGEDLSFGAFKDESPLKMAQILLGKPLATSLEVVREDAEGNPDEEESD